MANRASDPPLDEIQWRSPPLAQMMQGIHSNSVLPYFSNSPFFDQTSNNAVLTNQAMYNQNMLHIIATRDAFEGRLKTMSGLEYMVAQEPAEMAPGTGTGVWVIRKQTRRKRQGQEDEITVHSTYFVVGDNIYMAPGVGDVIGSRLLSIFTSLNKFVTTAVALPNFSPAVGHTYLPPPTANRLKGMDSQLSHASKETTPMADSLASTKKVVPSSAANSTFLSSRLLDESFNNTLRFGDEYMDENPINGHPGEFHLSTTGRQNKEKLVVQLPAKGSLQQQLKSPPAPTPEVKNAEGPISRKGSRVGDKSPKVAGMPKPKRRKSKTNTALGSVSPS